MTQARPGRADKQEQEQNSRNHVQVFLIVSVYTDLQLSMVHPMVSTLLADITLDAPKSNSTFESKVKTLNYEDEGIQKEPTTRFSKHGYGNR